MNDVSGGNLQDPIESVMNQFTHVLMPITLVLLISIVLCGFIKRAGSGPRYIPAPPPAPVTISTPPSTPPLPTARRLWGEATQIAHDLSEKMAAWEFDPEQRYFLRPLLADSNEALTSAWLDAKADLDAALPERLPADRARAQAARDAAHRASEAWDAAWRYAGVVGLGTLDVRDRRRMQQAQKILAQAADQATTEAERATCIDRIVTILYEVTAVDRTSILRTIATHVSAQLALPARQPRVAIAAAAQSAGPGAAVR